MLADYGLALEAGQQVSTGLLPLPRPFTLARIGRYCVHSLELSPRLSCTADGS